MKKRNNRFLAGTLAGLMMLTMLPVTALAAQESADGDAVSDTSNNIVNVVSDSENGQQAENNNVNVEGNGGTENGQKSADDSNGGSADTAAANQQEGEAGGSGSSGESAPTPTPSAEPFVAKIGTQTYDTLDAAIEAAESGAEIEIGNDEGVITVNEIRRNIVINGNGHTVTIPAQKTDNYSLNISGSLTFNNTNVKCANNADMVKAWSVSTYSNGVLTFDKGSTCTITKHGIYAHADSTINILGGSKLIIQNTTDTAMMAEKYAILNVEEDSKVFINNVKRNNGITKFKVNVVESTLEITNCQNQGLVSCYLLLDDSNAEISNNDIGITGYSGTKVLVMQNGSTLMMKDNKHSGIFMYGGEIDVQDGTALTITGTGNSVDDEVIDDYYVGGLAIRADDPDNSDAYVKFADNATVKIIDNAVSAIRNCGTVDIGAGTVIKNNGSKTLYGGGIQNYGKITVSAGAQLYNNHAQTAGDDIYNGTYHYTITTKDKVVIPHTYKGSITFAPVGDDWMLDDCKETYKEEHPIVGWYYDGENNRWNVHSKEMPYHAEEYKFETEDKKPVEIKTDNTELALKAAHEEFCNVTYKVIGDVPSDAGAKPAEAKVKKGGSYTVAPVQTTSQSRYTFSGWRINGVGDVVTEIKDIQQDVELIGVWTRRSSGGGGGSSKPTVDIPDDVPTGLNGDDHFAYIVGYPNGNVEPNGNITRAEVATIFFRLLTEEVRTANSTQSNSLSDVTRGQWFNHAVSTLSSMGIVKGHNDGTFAPNAPITRAEFAAIAARFDDKNTDTSSKFTDIASHWAKNEIGIAANKGWINGYPDGTFRPNQYITRAEAMTLVNRVLNRLPENSSDLLDSMIKWPDNSDASAWYYLAVQEATNSHAYSDKSKDDKYEKWTTIRDARDWTELEK